MKVEPGDIKIRRRHIAIYLALFLFSIYLFMYRGGFHSIDEVSMAAVTESLVKFGRFNTDQIAWTQWTTSQAEAQGFFGADGHVYSKKGLALSLAQAPLYGLALLLPGIGMLQTVSLLNAFVTAATGLLIFMFVHRLGFSLPTALFTGLIFGLATIAAVYAKYLFSEPLAGFLLLLAAYMLYAYRQEGGVRHIVIAGLGAGLAVLTRANNLFLLPVFGLYLLWIEYRLIIEEKIIIHRSSYPKGTLFIIRKLGFSLLVFAITLAIPGAILLVYNALRSGNPLQTGYDLTLFTPNVLTGLYKLLFSPLRGLFIYSPILLMSLPGWLLLRRAHPAEAWLFAGVVGVTLGLFSAWSSGEGLSWGSRFLVPVTPFFAVCLAPIVEKVAGGRWLVASGKPANITQNAPRTTHHVSRITYHVSRSTFYVLLTLSFLIQVLAVAINPWVFLAKLQTDFGGEFFLENTVALYDFRYSQIVGQIQSWSLANSDIVWWQPWGFDVPAFTLTFTLVLLTGRLLWKQITQLAGHPESQTIGHWSLVAGHSPFIIHYSSFIIILLLTYLFLVRIYDTDLQFGPPDDAYTQALTTIAAESPFTGPIITVAQNHYHVPMNRFRGNIPLIGFSQLVSLPDTAIPLLDIAAQSQHIGLVTVGFPPAAPDNAAEKWLAFNTYKINDDWLAGSVRVARFTAVSPTQSRSLAATFGDTIQLTGLRLTGQAAPNEPLPVEFTWLALVEPQTDYTLFLQLLNINGQVIAQTNSPPQGGYAPTGGWQAGQEVVSRHALLLPPAGELPPGDYRLIAGWFNPATGQRLPVDQGGDFVELGVVMINPSFVISTTSQVNDE